MRLHSNFNLSINVSFFWLIFLTFIPISGRADSWDKTFGLRITEYAQSVLQTKDGGFLMAGNSHGLYPGWYDFWPIRLDRKGNVLWQERFGGQYNDRIFDVKTTADGGYVASGETQSFGSGLNDVWIIKLGAGGKVQWQKVYGGPGNDVSYSISQTKDSGYIVGVSTAPYGSSKYRIGLLKLNANGDVVWYVNLTDQNRSHAAAVRQTSDGGYILLGSRTVSGTGRIQTWVLKLDANGKILWQKLYGGTANFVPISIQLRVNGYLIAGHTWSGSDLDLWLLSLDGAGNILWQKSYGGPDRDRASEVRQSSDGNFIVAGFTESFGAGETDIWLLKVDSNASVLWQRTLGGASRDEAYSVAPTSDGGYLVGGLSESFGDRTNGDIWLLKLDASGTVTGCNISTQDSDATPVDTLARMSPSFTKSFRATLKSSSVTKKEKMTLAKTGSSCSVPSPALAETAE